MNKTLSFIRLDFITVKPYLTLKNLLIFMGVALILLIANNDVTGVIAILMAFSALYASYPFAIGEKSNIDILYATLSIKRNTVVLGRYLFSITFDILVGFLAYIFSLIVLTIMQKKFGAIESLFTILIMFIVFNVIKAIQLPLFFKLGYTKAKLLAYLPFIVLPSAILIGSNLISDVFSFELIVSLFKWFAANFTATVCLGIVVWLGIMFVSYKISLSLYKKREF